MENNWKMNSTQFVAIMNLARITRNKPTNFFWQIKRFVGNFSNQRVLKGKQTRTEERKEIKRAEKYIYN